MNCDECRQWLDAYADDDVAQERLEALEEHLRICPVCAAESVARMQMKRAVRAAAAGQFSPSPEFRLRLERSIREKTPSRWTFGWLPALAGVAAVLLIAVSALLYTRHAAREQALAELIDLHVATTSSANPVDVISTDRHTVKPWFQGRLPFTFNLPEFGNTPFTLVGGRLAWFEQAPAAQLLVDLHKHQLSVFILEDHPGLLPTATGISDSSNRGFSIETWKDAGLRYVVVGDAAPSDLRTLGDLLRSANH